MLRAVTYLLSNSEGEKGRVKPPLSLDLSFNYRQPLEKYNKTTPPTKPESELYEEHSFTTIGTTSSCR